jgi:hypothetical protein
VLLYISHIRSAEQNSGTSTVLPLVPKPAHKNSVHKRSTVLSTVLAKNKF